MHPLLQLLTRPLRTLENTAPKVPLKMELINYELSKIRNLEKNASENNRSSNTIKSLKKARKKKSNAEIKSDSNRNLTKEEEFILEHATAYVFRQHTKARVDNDMKTHDRHYIPRDQQ